VLHRLKTLGYGSAHLGTDDWRVAAIRAYWSCGYVPEISDASHPARWAALEKYRDRSLVAPNVPAPSGTIGDELPPPPPPPALVVARARSTSAGRV
jgi:hypothetical protein